MDISVEQVKALRNKTGAGMMDCKRALIESNGDFDKAIEYLRKKGTATSQKRSDKIAKEGFIIAKTNKERNKSVIAEINCETDFVAKSIDFVNFANGVVDTALNKSTGNVNDLLETQMKDGLTVNDELSTLVGKVGEKIDIKRIQYQENSNGFYCEYNHLGNKVASLVELEGQLNEKGIELGNDLSMQVVAMKPIAVKREEIDKAVIEKEKDIYMTQARNEKKPENIVEKIAHNRVEKFYQENCLLEQEFVKESGKTVSDYIKEVSKEAGSEYKVKSMVRYQLGETLA